MSNKVWKVESNYQPNMVHEKYVFESPTPSVKKIVLQMIRLFIDIATLNHIITKFYNS